MEERQSRLSSMVWRRLRPYFCVRLILLNSMFSNFCHVLKREIFNTLRALSYSQNSGFGKTDILMKLSERGLDAETLRMLIDYYLILPFDSTTGKYYIGYRNSDPSDYDIDKDNIKYRLHKCIYAHFVPKSTLPNDA